MEYIVFGFAWLAVGVFLTAFLSGRYNWDADRNDDVFWIYIASTFLWPVALALWALIVPASKIHHWSKPKEKK